MKEIEKGQNDDEMVGTSACRRSRRVGEIQANDSGVRSESTANGFADGAEGVRNNVSYMEENVAIVEPHEENPDELLNEAGIELRIGTLLEYERGSVGIDGSFDFVLADPFQKVGKDPSAERSSTHNNHRNNTVLDELIDSKGVTLYVQSVRRVLRRGAYFLVFLEWHQIQQWKVCCIESQFEIVCEPLMVMKDPERVQRMTLKGLQSIYEPALVLRKPGEHPDGFELDKQSPYTHLPACRLPRWCNVIDGVPPAAQKVTFKPSRAQVRPNEKPCSLYIELLKTFCPPMGKVLDPFSATLTTGLACMATGRHCVLLETDETCLSYAKPRAVDFAKSRLIQQEQETNQETIQCGTQNCSSAVRTSVTENRYAEEGGDNEPGRSEEGDVSNFRSGSRTTEPESGSNTTTEERDTPSVLRASGSSTANSEREASEELQRSPMSSLYSPSVSNTRKQLSFVTSQNDNGEDRIASQPTDTLRRSSVVDEVSTPICKKRARTIRTPTTNHPSTIESSTPKGFRRSKRSRKVPMQYRD